MIGTIINYFLIGGLFLVTISITTDLTDKYKSLNKNLCNIEHELRMIRHDSHTLVDNLVKND